MTKPPQMQPFRDVGLLLRRKFPQLRFTVEENHPDVDAALDIPKQPGLAFPVHVDLQNGDELHLSAGGLSVSFFPVGEQKVFDRFLAAFNGLLSGTFRIVEYKVGPFTARAALQAPKVGNWEDIKSRTTPAALLPWRRRMLILQNVTR